MDYDDPISDLTNGRVLSEEHLTIEYIEETYVSHV